MKILRRRADLDFAKKEAMSNMPYSATEKWEWYSSNAGGGEGGRSLEGRGQPASLEGRRREQPTCHSPRSVGPTRKPQVGARCSVVKTFLLGFSMYVTCSFFFFFQCTSKARILASFLLELLSRFWVVLRACALYFYLVL